jgi:tetratricopeptide (TPR) repeat protein
VILLIAAGGLAGCATTQSRIAARAMHEGEYERAARILSTVAIEHPDDAKLWGRLGEAQYRSDQFDASRESFQRALHLDDRMHAAYLYLGYIAEQQDSVDLALDFYQKFLDQSGKQVAEVTRRITELRRLRAETFARNALAQERDLRPSSYSDSTVGVVYFNSDRLSESLRPLAKGLSAMLVTDLSRVPGLRVVERLRTDKLLEELALTQMGAFDTSSAPRVGKLLGAAHVIGGDASELSHGRLRFDPQMVQTKTGEVSLPPQQTGDLAEFFRLEKAMVFDIVDQLGFTLTESERDSIAQIPTESIVAFLAYSRGLDLHDRGMYKAARKEFQRATSLDPDFKEADERAQEARLLSEAPPADEPGDVASFARSSANHDDWGEAVIHTDRRLDRLLDNTGLMRPGRGEDDPDQPPSGGTTVIINGGFDDPQR